MTKAEMLSLLTRCWCVIRRITAQNCAVPTDIIDEMLELDAVLAARLQ